MIAFLFPGQGSQHAGMLADCVATLYARELFESASEIVGTDVLKDDDEAALKNTEIVQRNVFLAGVAGAAALAKCDVVPQIVAGHSIGAFVAAVVAGVLAFPDALRLVEIRANAMATALGPGYCMGAVLGLSERDVRAIVEAVRGETAVDIAAVNAVDQIVVSGTENGVERVLAAATARGARNVRYLEVPIASHTSLLASVRDRLASAFEAVETKAPRIPVAANVDGRALFAARDVVSDLIDGVAKPVRWLDATQMLYERGTTCFVEAFLGDTLIALCEVAFPEVSAASLGRSGLATTVLLANRYGF